LYKFSFIVYSLIENLYKQQNGALNMTKQTAVRMCTTFAISVCPKRGYDSFSIPQFLKVLERNYPYEVISVNENDQTCYQAHIQLDEAVDPAGMEEFMMENESGETWSVQLSIVAL